jgi:hypothetical protein
MVLRMMIKTVLLAMLALPPYFPERDTVAERNAMLAEIAPAIIREAKGDRELAAFVISIGWHETKFSPRLGRSECRPYECDPRRFTLPDGRKIVEHRARGLFKLHRFRSQTDAEWEALLGPDSLDAQVKEVVKRSRWALAKCRGQTDALAKSFGAYGSGKGCVVMKRSRERVETLERVKARIW